MLSKFYHLLLFPLALIRWNSSHCHLMNYLMELFLPKRCLFIFCIFYLNEKELNQQVYLIKYVENKFSNSTSHKKKTDRNKNIIQLQKHFQNCWKIFTSCTSYWLSQIFTFTTCGQTLTKIWKPKIGVKFWF